MKVAVIGAGAMGGMHAALLSEHPDVGEVLVCDADGARAATVAAGAGGRVVAQDEALEAAGAVVIATPAHLHGAAVLAAIDRGVAALCEKPLTNDLRSSAALVERIERAGAHVQVGFQRRYDPAFAAARQRIIGGETGPVHLLRLTALDPRAALRPAHEWIASDAAPLFLHSAVHDFDLVRWMTGQEIVEVMADASRPGHPRPADTRDIETAVVTMRLADGALAMLDASWLHPIGYDIRVEVVAEHSHLSMGLSPRTPSDRLDWPGSDEPPWSGYLERFGPAYRAELSDFLAAVAGGRPPTATVRDAHEGARIAVAATRAYVERRPIALAEIPGLPSSEAA